MDLAFLDKHVSLAAASKRPANQPPRQIHLTHREWEVLNAIAAGLTSKEIAAALGVTYNTLETHRVNIYRKLGVHSMIQAARIIWISTIGPRSD